MSHVVEACIPNTAVPPASMGRSRRGRRGAGSGGAGQSGQAGAGTNANGVSPTLASFLEGAISTFPFAPYASGASSVALPPTRGGALTQHPHTHGLYIDESEQKLLGAPTDINTWLIAVAQGRGAMYCVAGMLADLTELDAGDGEAGFRVRGLRCEA